MFQFLHDICSEIMSVRSQIILVTEVLMIRDVYTRVLRVVPVSTAIVYTLVSAVAPFTAIDTSSALQSSYTRGCNDQGGR